MAHLPMPSPRHYECLLQGLTNHKLTGATVTAVSCQAQNAFGFFPCHANSTFEFERKIDQLPSGIRPDGIWNICMPGALAYLFHTWFCTLETQE